MPCRPAKAIRYFGVAPAIQIVKLTNGADNANALVAPGSKVTWTYDVTNTGNVAFDAAWRLPTAIRA